MIIVCYWLCHEMYVLWTNSTFHIQIWSLSILINNINSHIISFKMLQGFSISFLVKDCLLKWINFNIDMILREIFIQLYLTKCFTACHSIQSVVLAPSLYSLNPHYLFYIVLYTGGSLLLKCNYLHFSYWLILGK